MGIGTNVPPEEVAPPVPGGGGGDGMVAATPGNVTPPGLSPGDFGSCTHPGVVSGGGAAGAGVVPISLGSVCGGPGGVGGGCLERVTRWVPALPGMSTSENMRAIAAASLVVTPRNWIKQVTVQLLSPL